MPVLADQQDLVLIVDGEHGHRAGMLDDVAFGFLTVRHSHRVTPEAHDAALGGHHGARNRPGLGHIAEPGRCIGDAHALATERPPATAATDCGTLDLDRSSAAAINPLNSGWGLVGLDRNSG